jgi:hypothetical protein
MLLHIPVTFTVYSFVLSIKWGTFPHTFQLLAQIYYQSGSFHTELRSIKYDTSANSKHKKII